MKQKLLMLCFAASLSLSTNAQQKDIFDLARSGSTAEIKHLVKSDNDLINKVNDRGFTPLILAAYRNNEAAVNFLAPKVNNIDYNSSAGTALTAACYQGLTSIVAVLLKNKANPNIADANGTTPLIYATIGNHVDIIQLLLQYNADKKHKDNKGNSALQYALVNNNNKLITLLK